MGFGLIFFLHYKVVVCVFWCKSLKEIMSFMSHKCSQPICTEFLSVHLLRYNRNCSLDTSTTVTKLGRHIDMIMVRPVILHMTGIVLGYWRNGCSYRNIAR